MVAIELAGCYHSQLSVRPDRQRNFLTDAQLLVDPAEVAGREDTDGAAMVVLRVVDRIRLDVHGLQVTVQLPVLSKKNN